MGEQIVNFGSGWESYSTKAFVIDMFCYQRVSWIFSKP